jgi:glutathione synthase/RimK-type ligase-like ATP-grasp enzyme
MSARVAILTPDPGDEAFDGRWREVLEEDAAPLRRAGLTVEGRPWVDVAGFADFDLILPLLTWGYHRAGPGWAAAVSDWEARGMRLQNSASVLRWNADKLYLGRLAARGAPVVPTLYVERVDEAALRHAAAAFGTDALIAKPQISASAWQTIRWSPGAPLDGGPDGAAMIQPFLPDILGEGEISLIYIAGAFSHAIRKRPQPGDFRVQPEFDGIITPHAPAPDERAAAAAILAAVDEDLLYARIDVARDPVGQVLLMELELVEPDLYFQHDPQGGAAFAEAVARAASLPSPAAEAQ